VASVSSVTAAEAGDNEIIVANRVSAEMILVIVGVDERKR